jgi:endonuclease G
MYSRKIYKMKIFLILFIMSSSVYAKGISHKCTNDKLIAHNFYDLCYNFKYKLSKWTSYSLTDDMLKGKTKRTNNFRSDPLLAMNESPTNENDYKYTGYDRGHLVPAADMKINLNAMNESFYMTNMAPQHPSFNRGIWKRLENQVRRITNVEKKVHIVTGPVFNFKKKVTKDKRLSIPKQFFKIIYIEHKKFPKMIAFLMNNKKSNLHIDKFIVSVDEVERLTGIDFFENLPSKLEESLESSVEQLTWK